MSYWGHVEFHVKDLERVIQFYWAVFGWEILEAGEGDEKKPVITHDIKWPEKNKLIVSKPIKIDGVKLPDVLFTVEVASMPETLSRVSLWDGQIVLTDVAGPKKGTISYCKDTEGNLFSILQPHSR